MSCFFHCCFLLLLLRAITYVFLKTTGISQSLVSLVSSNLPHSQRISLCLKCFLCHFHSMLLEMRCQVHSELAVIEEEEGRLEASLAHLQKAMLLDNGTQRERLSSAVHLLQLRGTLYQTPSRTEDKAAMLMQQVLSPSASNSPISHSITAVYVKHTM